MLLQTDVLAEAARFQSELLTDEKVLWTGRPGPSLLTRADIFLIPFSVIWGGGMLCTAIGMLFDIGPFKQGAMRKGRNGGEPFPFPMGIVIAFFSVIALYMTVGRFIFKSWRKKRTFYAVTSRRVMVLRDGNKKSLQAMFIKSIPAVDKSNKSNGTGTLRFGNGGGPYAIYEDTGFDIFGKHGGGSTVTFQEIPNVDEVYRLVLDQQERA